MPDTIRVIVESLPKHNSSTLEILNSLLTPAIALITTTIAIITAYIARQQYKINKDKLRLELFEKRFSIYTLINDVVLNLRHEDDPFSIKISEEDIQNYLTKVDGYIFLFDHDVINIIHKLNHNLKQYLFNYSLMKLLTRETIDRYYAKKEYLYYMDDKVEHFSNYFEELSFENQEEYIRNEFETMEFESTAFDYIEKVETNYKIFVKEVDKYINFKTIR